MTSKDKNKFFGIAATIIFHAVAAVLLLTLCFRTPLPLPGEAGVEVNLGMYAQGLGNESSQPQEVDKNIAEPIKTTPKVEESSIHEENDIVSEDEETPSIEERKEEVIEEKTEEKVEKKTEEEIVEEKTEEIIEEKPVVNQRAIFQAPKKDKIQSSEGDTDGEGEQGSENGLKDIDRYEGNGGSGEGPAFDLGGRGAKSISSPSKDFDEVGKIVVEIWVDKDGIVKRAEIGKGTTIINDSMRKSALEAAHNSIFNKDENASELQKGTITYTFIFRQ